MTPDFTQAHEQLAQYQQQKVAALRAKWNTEN
jgi:hypothetical protein